MEAFGTRRHKYMIVNATVVGSIATQGNDNYLLLFLFPSSCNIANTQHILIRKFGKSEVWKKQKY